jgi:hypothetical protein
MTREEVIGAIQKASEKLGHVPSMNELVGVTSISRYEVRKHFGVYAAALEACGLERHGSGYELGLKALFPDWSEIVRRLGKVPTVAEYAMHSRYSPRPLTRYFGGWAHVPAGMMQYARQQGMEEEIKDVLEVVAKHLEAENGKTRNSRLTTGTTLRPGLLKGEPVYGPPMVDAHLMLAPTNEQGVLFLFGAIARKLGFVALRIQTEYPDCEALREMEPEQWQRIRIEFEYESRNFLKHGHSPERCHLIVCWRHNWEESPLEVLELRSAVKMLADDET